MNSYNCPQTHPDRLVAVRRHAELDERGNELVEALPQPRPEHELGVVARTSCGGGCGGGGGDGGEQGLEEGLERDERLEGDAERRGGGEEREEGGGVVEVGARGEELQAERLHLLVGEGPGFRLPLLSARRRRRRRR